MTETWNLRAFALNLVSVLVVVFVIGELLVRSFFQMPVVTVEDPDIGWTYLPDTRIVHSVEGWAVNRTNSFGYIDREVDLEWEGKRVLVFGDSMVEALNVEMALNFTSLIERQFPCIDVINTGRSGLSPLQYPAVLRKIRRVFEPDLLVVVVNNSDLADIEAAEVQIIRDDEGRILNLEFQSAQLHWLRQALEPILRRSALLAMLATRFRIVFEGGAETVQKGTTREVDPEIEELLRFTLTELSQTFPVLLVSIPEMVYQPDRQATIDIDRKPILDVYKSLENDSVEHISLVEPFRQSYLQEGQPPIGFQNSDVLGGHLNEMGHQAVARAIAPVIEQHLGNCSDTASSELIAP